MELSCMQFAAFHKPTTIDEALRLLRNATGRSVVMAGGTWLNGESTRDVSAVVDISGLGLNRIEHSVSPATIRIGASVTLEELRNYFVDVSGLDTISFTAAATAPLNIRNQATISGAIVTADSLSPLVTALLACDAELHIEADESRRMSLSAFLAYRDRLINQPLLITHIVLPVPSPDTHSAYERVARTPKDHPIVCAVAKCATKDGIAGNVRIAVGGAAALPIRLSAAEYALEKKEVERYLDAAVNEAVRLLAPPNDWLGSTHYRKAMVQVLVTRAVRRAAGL